MGIYLYNHTGGDSFAVTGVPDPNSAGPGTTFDGDIFTYTVDVSVGETVVIAGDFGNDDTPNGGANFAVSGGAPSFGTLVVNTDGTFTYTFDRALLDASGGNQTITFQVSGLDGFGLGDTDTVNIVTTCFARGTLIATPGGETAVETLKIGDLLRTADGRDVPVKWIGRQSLMPATLGARSEPVLIEAGALGNTLPHSDLTVTADHGMIVDDLVINASALVGGAGINWVATRDLPPRFTVYHIETEEHDVILANGAPTETFCDAAGRAMFDNHAEYLDLYGTEKLVPELDLPRISAQRLLPAATRAKLGMATQLNDAQLLQAG